MKLTKSEQKYLLDLSRSALKHIFQTGREIDPKTLDIPDKFQEKKATFVTLTKKGQLRGCVGSLLPARPLHLDIIKNTYGASFSDARFPQLSEKELENIKIEISILAKPHELIYINTKDLISKLEKQKPGVILQQGIYSATFLPQVWKELNTPEKFLSHLCLKAGLARDTWKEERLHIQIYKVLKFNEN